VRGSAKLLSERVGVGLWRCRALPRELRLARGWQRGGTPVVAVGVHGYAPATGGSELHAQCVAEGLRARGYATFVLAPRRWGEPLSVNGVPVGVHRFLLSRCDVLFTYSVSDQTIALAEYVVRMRRRSRPLWLHHPCAVGGECSLDLIRACDVVVAMNPQDVALAVGARGSAARVVDVVPASHPRRTGTPDDGSFRDRVGIEGDYILWLGAWLPAKGVRSLSRRFAALRARRPDLPVKLVMLGGYGGARPDAVFPDPHPDIVCPIDGSVNVAAALAGCTFLAFNAPPHPTGYDANPLVLFEAMMNGKTFLAQAGTPILPKLAHLGRVVETDEEWLRAAERLLVDAPFRRWLERRCTSAYRSRYNLDTMIDGVERAIAVAQSTASSSARIEAPRPPRLQYQRHGGSPASARLVSSHENRSRHRSYANAPSTLNSEKPRGGRLAT
jgi:glycosyltransferase involved in cell wall biosynthesis